MFLYDAISSKRKIVSSKYSILNSNIGNPLLFNTSLNLPLRINWNPSSRVLRYIKNLNRNNQGSNAVTFLRRWNFTDCSSGGSRPSDKGEGGGGASRPWDKGGARPRNNFFSAFGPHFDLKIREEPLDPPLCRSVSLYSISLSIKQYFLRNRYYIVLLYMSLSLLPSLTEDEIPKYDHS